MNSQWSAALTRLMNAVPKPKDGNGGNHRIRGLVKNAMQTAAETIGIDVKDVVAEVKGGKTIAQVAGEHGTTGDAVISALTSRANAAIDQAVADGKLTSDKAVDAKAKAEAAITKLVNETRPRPLRAQGQ